MQLMPIFYPSKNAGKNEKPALLREFHNGLIDARSVNIHKRYESSIGIFNYFFFWNAQFPKQWKFSNVSVEKRNR